MDFEPVYIKIEDASRILGVGRKWLYDHTSRYEPIVPHYRPGGPRGHLMFIESELHEFMRSQKSTSLAQRYQNSLVRRAA